MNAIDILNKLKGGVTRTMEYGKVCGNKKSCTDTITKESTFQVRSVRYEQMKHTKDLRADGIEPSDQEPRFRVYEMDGNKYTIQEGIADNNKGTLHAAVAFHKNPTATMPPTVWKRNGVVVDKESVLGDILAKDHPKPKKDGAWGRLPIENINAIR